MTMVKESSGVDQKSTMLQLVDLWRKSGSLVRILSDFHCMLKVPISIEHFSRSLKSTIIERIGFLFFVTCFVCNLACSESSLMWCMEQMLNTQKL